MDLPIARTVEVGYAVLEDAEDQRRGSAEHHHAAEQIDQAPPLGFHAAALRSRSARFGPRLMETRGASVSIKTIVTFALFCMFCAACHFPPLGGMIQIQRAEGWRDPRLAGMPDRFPEAIPNFGAMARRRVRRRCEQGRNLSRMERDRPRPSWPLMGSLPALCARASILGLHTGLRLTSLLNSDPLECQPRQVKFHPASALPRQSECLDWAKPVLTDCRFVCPLPIHELTETAQMHTSEPKYRRKWVRGL